MRHRVRAYLDGWDLEQTWASKATARARLSKTKHGPEALHKIEFRVIWPQVKPQAPDSRTRFRPEDN